MTTSLCKDGSVWCAISVSIADEVVLVAIKLKELAQGEFDVTDFDTLETVGDLEDMVWAWAHGTAAREGRRFDSGIMLKREVASGESETELD